MRGELDALRADIDFFIAKAQEKQPVTVSAAKELLKAIQYASNGGNSYMQQLSRLCSLIGDIIARDFGRNNFV